MDKCKAEKEHHSTCDIEETNEEISASVLIKVNHARIPKDVSDQGD